VGNKVHLHTHEVCSRSWLLLLALVKCEQRHTRNLDDLETAAGNITLGLASLSEARNKNLVVFVDIVQATVARHEARNLLAVLD